MNLLIIEDDDALALVLRAALRSVASKIQRTATLSDGLAVLSASPVDLVLIDLSLSDSTTRSTLLRIPDLKRLSKWVVVMTGNSAPNLNEMVTEAGADACFYKGSFGFIDWLKLALAGREDDTHLPVK